MARKSRRLYGGSYGVVDPDRAVLAPPSRKRRFVMVPSAEIDDLQAAADEALDTLARMSCADPGHDAAEAAYQAASAALAAARKRQRVAQVQEVR